MIAVLTVAAALILLIPVCYIFLPAALIRFGMLGQIGDGSMQPAYAPHETVMALPHPLGRFRRFAVVCVRPRRGRRGFRSTPESWQIRRIVGLPGETVQIRDGTVFVDGKALVKDPGGRIERPGIAKSAVKLGKGEYFVLCDNRECAKDSRKYGAVRREDVRRRVIGRHKRLSVALGRQSRDAAKRYTGVDIWES